VGCASKPQTGFNVDFEMSKDKVLNGRRGESMILSEEEKRNTAFTAGHALVPR